MPDSWLIREGQQEDIPLLLSFIKQLAQYEELPGNVVATEELLTDQLFSLPRTAYFLIAEINHKPVGYALYYYTFSTYLGRKSLYLEDLFIKPEIRGKGYGFKLFKYIATIAAEEQCGRMEWSVVNWNQPAISFYQKLGAKPKNENTGYSLDQRALSQLTSDSQE